MRFHMFILFNPHICHILPKKRCRNTLGQLVDKQLKMFLYESAVKVFCMELNWVTDARGSRMEFDNPNAASSCGCGETFNV